MTPAKSNGSADTYAFGDADGHLFTPLAQRDLSDKDLRVFLANRATEHLCALMQEDEVLSADEMLWVSNVLQFFVDNPTSSRSPWGRRALTRLLFPRGLELKSPAAPE